jgi:putative ABC transport system ATP-binding protein
MASITFPSPAVAAVPDAPAPPILDAKGVWKTYRSGPIEVHALRGIDLTIAPGELVGVVGPSGSGKTTLLNCLSGLDSIDGGEVFIAGEEIHSMSDRRRTAYRAQAMGFVFQAFNLIPVFSAMENVELPLLLNGTHPRIARNRAEEVLRAMELGERLDHRPSELSGGEQQRVTIARALGTKPAIVWADEPTGNLDSESAERVIVQLRALNDEGLTIVLVTHDRGIAAELPRTITMRDGEVVADQTRR